ncbi:MAG: sensor histidine kinase [Deltaproteobacteria bacterium]|nr:sensor histidine kinase [Deltaproteobacteria bacterium]
MKTTVQKRDDQGLRFFGQVIASVTHDIKNSLATINENAGLLTDHAAMAARGRPLDPEKVNVLAMRIMDQVKRADGLLKNMNRFAHSVDDSLKKVDLNEILQLLAALSVRFAAMSGANLDVQPSPKPVVIETSPFGLLNTLFLCLEVAMTAAGQGGSIGLRPEKTDNGACVHFGPLPDAAMSNQDHCLSAFIDARLVKNSATGTLTLIIHDR